MKQQGQCKQRRVRFLLSIFSTLLFLLRLSLAFCLFVEIDNLIALLDSFPLWFSLLVAGGSESFDVGFGSWRLIFTTIDGEKEIFPIIVKMFQLGLGQFTKMWYNTFFDGGIVIDLFYCLTMTKNDIKWRRCGAGEAFVLWCFSYISATDDQVSRIRGVAQPG